MPKTKDVPPVTRRTKIVDAAELGYRAELARGQADEYRALVTGVLAGLVAPAVTAAILDPSWTGERFWL